LAELLEGWKETEMQMRNAGDTDTADAIEVCAQMLNELIFEFMTESRGGPRAAHQPPRNPDEPPSRADELQLLVLRYRRQERLAVFRRDYTLALAFKDKADDYFARWEAELRANPPKTGAQNSQG
jgi:hypothetical protein